MPEYQKQKSISGTFVKGSDITSGTKCKLLTAAEPVTSQFKNKDGSPKMQDVAKIKFQGNNEIFNISLNRATLNGLVDAFGTKSEEWIDKVLTAITEKVVVGGKRVTAIYLVPDGYEMKENNEGYVEISKIGGKDIPEFPLEDIDEPEIGEIPF